MHFLKKNLFLKTSAFEHSDVRYMVNGFEEDDDEFIDFELAVAAPSAPVQEETLLDHQYAAIEEHRYEEPPGDWLDD